MHEKSSAQHKFPQRATVKKCSMNNVKLGKWPPPPTRGSTRVLVGGDQNSTDWLFARLKRHSFILVCCISTHSRMHEPAPSVPQRPTLEQPPRALRQWLPSAAFAPLQRPLHHPQQLPNNERDHRAEKSKKKSFQKFPDSSQGLGIERWWFCY